MKSPANFNQTWHNASLGEGIQVCSKEGPRPFPIGYNYEIANIHWQNFKKNVFLQNHLAISTKLITKHPGLMGIQFCSNGGPCPFTRGGNYKIAKIHWQNLNIFFYRTTGPISTILSTNDPGWRGLKFVQIKNHSVDNEWFSSLNVMIIIIICVYWFGLFS